MSIVVYGIPNCDTIKKTRRYLDAAGKDYTYHDFRKDGLDADTLNLFVAQVGWETVLNKRGTTWRKLDDETKANIDAASAMALMLEQPAMIKRPVIQQGDAITVGYNEAILDAL